MKEVLVGSSLGAAAGILSRKKHKESRAEKVVRGILLGGVLGHLGGHIGKVKDTSKFFFKGDTKKFTMSDKLRSLSADLKKLGLNKSTVKTKKEVKMAYRKKAMKHHPDRPSGSNSKFVDINTAHKGIKKTEWYEKLAYLRRTKMSKADFIIKKAQAADSTKVDNSKPATSGKLTEEQQYKLDNPWLYSNRYHDQGEGNLIDDFGYSPKDWEALDDSTKKSNYFKLQDLIKIENEEYFKKYPKMKGAQPIPSDSLGTDKEGSYNMNSKADVVLEKVGQLKALKAGLKWIDKGIQTIGRKVLGKVKKTKLGKKKLKNKKWADARKKNVKRVAGGATVATGAYTADKLIT